MKKLACFILSYDITKGMKSIGPKALLRSKKSKELINCQIDNIKDKNIDIYILLGFCSEKIQKKIEHSQVNIIKNDLYETANQGYAFELILKNYDIKAYEGCIIIDNGVLLSKEIKNSLLNSDRSKSKIYYTNSHNKNFPIGFTVIDSKVQHMFYSLGENMWSEILYMDNNSLLAYKKIYSTNMRNMFLFEIINKAIDKGIPCWPVKIKSSSVIKISGIKDSNKIKEIV